MRMIVGELFRGHECDATLSPLSCAIFAPVLREWVDRRRSEGWTFQGQVWDDLECVEHIAEALRRARDAKQTSAPSEVATVVAATAKRLSPETLGAMKEVTAIEAARRLGVSKSAVTKSCRERKLPARKNERGQWLIREENLTHAG